MSFQRATRTKASLLDPEGRTALRVELFLPGVIPILKARHLPKFSIGFRPAPTRSNLFQGDKSGFSGYITNTYYCFRYTAVPNPPRRMVSMRGNRVGHNSG